MNKIKFIGLALILAMFVSQFTYAQKLPSASKKNETETEQQTGKLPSASKKNETETKTEEPASNKLPSASKSKTSTTTNKQTASTSAKSDYFTGYVVSLNAVMTGNYSLTKDEALKLVETGAPIVLLSSKSKDGKIYFLVNKDGSSAAKTFANYAAYKKVRVTGAYKYVNRTRYIVVDTIEPAE